jgi:hypothetical protein
MQKSITIILRCYCERKFHIRIFVSSTRLKQNSCNHSSYSSVSHIPNGKSHSFLAAKSLPEESLILCWCCLSLIHDRKCYTYIRRGSSFFSHALKTPVSYIRAGVGRLSGWRMKIVHRALGISLISISFWTGFICPLIIFCILSVRQVSYVTFNIKTGIHSI